MPLVSRQLLHPLKHPSQLVFVQCHDSWSGSPMNGSKTQDDNILTIFQRKALLLRSTEISVRNNQREKMQQAKFVGRAWRFHGLLGHDTIPAPLRVYQADGPEPHTFRTLWSLHHRGMADMNSILNASFLKRTTGRAENSKDLIMAWSFPWPALILEPLESTWSGLIRTKVPPITQEFTKVSGGFFYQEWESKTKFRTKVK